MALSTKHFTFFFFFLSLLSSHLSHARESKFFSKVTTTNPKETVEVPNKALTKQEQEPSFIPDTQSGYGLYGHESGQLPPTTTTKTTTTTTNNVPYTTTPTTNSNNYYYNNEAYVSDPQGMSDTRFMDKGSTTTTTTATATNNHYYNQEAYVTEPQGYTTPTTTTNENNYYYNGAKNYNTQPQGGSRYTVTPTTTDSTAAANNKYYYNGGINYKQGMSDTRYLENGKYYYDVERENNYRNGYQNSGGVEYNNNKGYYGNYNENSMEGYQNQEEFQQGQGKYVP